ncbi:MAG: hypothetical protein ACK5HU_01560 [Flavobacteriales bacterium]
MKHSFHIPVMGTSYTIDSPAKVAHLGISSVISLVDDDLIERMRKVYSKKMGIAYEPIKDKEEDSRAKRITAYLNLINEIVEGRYSKLKKAFQENSQQALNEFKEFFPDVKSFKNFAKGSIDVNIMTKIDKENFKGKVKLPSIFNDAHAALRGFANSKLNSSIVLSAGMNPRLYAYFEEFKDFFPNEKGELKKKIIVKVSDFRSALVQGKFFAKKGLWVSEFRLESGLNCGGHAFATNGLLMGPILEEFKNKKEELIQELKEIYNKALLRKNYKEQNKVNLAITAQGGIGTAEEHNFLIDHYQVDSVGWGSPFLLVDEAVTIDEKTKNKLAQATEEDLYLSNASPLGVPFNNLKSSSKKEEGKILYEENRPGSPCTKKFLISNKEYTEDLICTASRKYIDSKFKNTEEVNEGFVKSTIEKECLCQGLSKPAFIKYNENEKKDGAGVSVCPGPNIAYFNEKTSLKKMIAHIYGKENIMHNENRPNVFIKELSLYVQDIESKYQTIKEDIVSRPAKRIKEYKENLLKGIQYYEELAKNKKNLFFNQKSFEKLNVFKEKLELLKF